MDILYYSNECPYSQKVIKYIAKNGLIDKINAICVDKRTVDKITGEIYVRLENGKLVMLPPNVHSVPAILMVKNNYSSIFGQDIINYFEPVVKGKMEEAHKSNGEPLGVSLAPSSAGVAIMSEQYTFYDLSPDDLSAKSRSEKRPMHNYVSASHQPYKIPTPPDTYRPDKIGDSVSIETLTQKRNNDISNGKETAFGF